MHFSGTISLIAWSFCCVTFAQTLVQRQAQQVQANPNGTCGPPSDTFSVRANANLQPTQGSQL